MGKWRHELTGQAAELMQLQDEALAQQQQQQLPPPPPLQPMPGLLASAAATAAARDASAFTLVEQLQEPLDYSMKSLRGQQMPTPPSPPASLTSSSASVGSPDEVLHRLRHTVLQRQPRRAPGLLQLQLQLQSQPQPQRHQSLSLQQSKLPPPAASESAADLKATYAAACIKTRLEGCGKRVHLFLGILLHFGMPPGSNGEQMFQRVIAFSDEQKQLCDRPTQYFMVLDSKLLALIWCKFKGNSSNEYSTLTRAIRSTRQKYKGIFETVENPGKKLYKFGPIALEQFRQLFPGSYATKREAA